MIGGRRCPQSRHFSHSACRHLLGCVSGSDNGINSVFDCGRHRFNQGFADALNGDKKPHEHSDGQENQVV
tara:strand:- start:22 stop:231 length:210 start_codon:yes stop_codon:yes gene_type:complete